MKSIYTGANRIDAIINNIDLLIIPLNEKITNGITNNDTALKTVFLLKQKNHIVQYSATSTIFTIRYIENASSDHQLNHVPGILKIMKPKHPNLPVCSIISTNLLFHLFSKSSYSLLLHFSLFTISELSIYTKMKSGKSVYT